MQVVIALPNVPNAHVAGFLKDLRNEFRLLIIVFVALIVMLKLTYNKEGVTEVLRASASLFWLFIMPGYFLTLYWRERLGFLERTALGSVAAFAVIGITSYYLGLAGLRLQNQTVLLPLAVIALSFAACLKSWVRKNLQMQQQLKQQ